MSLLLQYYFPDGNSRDSACTIAIFSFQNLGIGLPADSPELQFPLHIYPDGNVEMQRSLYVNNITLELAGIISGVDDLIIGSNGIAIIRLVSTLSELPCNVTRTSCTLKIQSDFKEICI